MCPLLFAANRLVQSTSACSWVSPPCVHEGGSLPPCVHAGGILSLCACWWFPSVCMPLMPLPCVQADWCFSPACMLICASPLCACWLILPSRLLLSLVNGSRFENSLMFALFVFADRLVQCTICSCELIVCVLIGSSSLCFLWTGWYRVLSVSVSLLWVYILVPERAGGCLPRVCILVGASLCVLAGGCFHCASKLTHFYCFVFWPLPCVYAGGCFSCVCMLVGASPV